MITRLASGAAVANRTSACAIVRLIGECRVQSTSNVNGSRIAKARIDTASDAFEASPLRQILVTLVTLKIVGILLIFDVGGLQAFDLVNWCVNSIRRLPTRRLA